MRVEGPERLMESTIKLSQNPLLSQLASKAHLRISPPENPPKRSRCGKSLQKVSQDPGPPENRDATKTVSLLSRTSCEIIKPDHLVRISLSSKSKL